MEIRRYKKLKEIPIEKSGIIKNSINDPIYKFCVLNKIDNLGDFITTYYIKRDSMDKRYSFSYFDGVIDLINLVFFKDDLPKVNELNKIIKIYKTDNSTSVFAYIESDVVSVGRLENMTLKRLGFNNKEAKIILNQVLNIGKEVSIIEAIKSCLDNFNFNNGMSCDDQMFITKLYVLYQYYDEHKNFLKNEEDIYSKFNDLYSRMLKAQEELIKCYCDFKEELSKLPLDDEKAKSLVRKFDHFNCK